MNAKICSGLVFVLEFEKRYTLYIQNITRKTKDGVT